jgi:hypothetical protein
MSRAAPCVISTLPVATSSRSGPTSSSRSAMIDTSPPGVGTTTALGVVVEEPGAGVDRERGVPGVGDGGDSG